MATLLKPFTTPLKLNQIQSPVPESYSAFNEKFKNTWLFTNWPRFGWVMANWKLTIEITKFRWFFKVIKNLCNFIKSSWIWRIEVGILQLVQNAFQNSLTFLELMKIWLRYDNIKICLISTLLEGWTRLLIFIILATIFKLSYLSQIFINFQKVSEFWKAFWMSCKIPTSILQIHEDFIKLHGFLIIL